MYNSRFIISSRGNNVKKLFIKNIKHIKKTNLTPILIQLTNYLPVNEASLLEGTYVDKYKKDNWTILNKVKTGGIGFGKIIWTKEKCHEEALKYSSRKEFGDKSSHPYTISLNNNWMDDICSHMKIIGNLHKRCIYVYEFSDNHAYIGLTYNFDIRHKEHLECERSIVRKHTETNSSYELKQLTKYIDVDKAKLLEGKYVEKYKKSGWLILNKIKTGGIGGGNLKWTKERCHEEALKYFSKIDYKNHCPQYRKVKEKGWLDDIWSHMKDDLNKTNGYWTKEKCQEEALKYSTRNEFFKKSSGVYNKCQKRKWIDDVCFHMSGKRYKPHGYWTKEKCQEESLKYETKKDFKRNSLSVYSICVQNKWIEELCSHMK